MDTKFSTPMSPSGVALIDAAVALEYNEIAKIYGAAPLPVLDLTAVKPKRPSNARFRLKSAWDVMRSEPIGWRIKGVLPELGIAAIYGPSGSGKSFLAMDMAISLAQGSEWFGYRVNSCPVVYVCLEGEAGLSVRLAAHDAKSEIEGMIDFVDEPLSLLKPKDVTDLVEAIEARRRGNGVVIIDTLNRATPGMDENSSVDMGSAIEAVKRMNQRLGGLVILVHHAGKDATRGMRGHSSLHAALDAAIEVRRTLEGREWLVAKAKDGSDGKSHRFSLDVVRVGEDSDGDPITSCVVRPTGDRQTAEKRLTKPQSLAMEAFTVAASTNPSSEAGRLSARLERWREEFYRLSTADNPESKRKAFNRAREDLVVMKKLFVDDDVYSLSNNFY